MMKQIFSILVGLTLTITTFSTDKQTYLYSVKGVDSLRLDLYNVTSSAPSPCVVFVFGGGFFTGARDADYYMPYFEFLNSKGYAVVSIDYRLGMKNLSHNDTKIGRIVSIFRNAVTMAVEDLYDATLFVLNHAEEWNIAPEKIVASGSSAGAITSLQAENEICNNTALASKLPQGFNYAAVISFAGAIVKVGEGAKWETTPCPLLLFHGDADKNVPYSKMAVGHIFGMYGSQYIVKKLNKINAPYYFYSADNVDHSMASSPMHDKHAEIAFFLDEYVVGGKFLQIVESVNDLSLPNLPNKFKIGDYISSNFSGN